jgi:hypothetical protein
LTLPFGRKRLGASTSWKERAMSDEREQITEPDEREEDLGLKDEEAEQVIGGATPIIDISTIAGESQDARHPSK